MANKLLDTGALSEIKKYIKEIQLDDVIIYAIQPTNKNVWIDLMNNYIFPKYREGFPLYKIIICSTYPSSGWGHKGLFWLNSVVLPEDVEDTSSSSLFYAYEFNTDVDMNYWGNNPSSKRFEEMYIQNRRIRFTVKQTGITAVEAIASNSSTVRFLSPNVNYPTVYKPEYPGSPATKQYVDDSNMLGGYKVFLLPKNFDLSAEFVTSVVEAGTALGYEKLMFIISTDFVDRRCGVFLYAGYENSYADDGVTITERKEVYRGIHTTCTDTETTNGLTTSFLCFPEIRLVFDGEGNFTDYETGFMHGDEAAIFLKDHGADNIYQPDFPNAPANKAYVDSKAIFHDVTLNDDGSVAATPTSLNIDKVISNINKGAVDFLRVTWGTVTFLATSTGVSDTNPDVVQFVASFEAFEQQRYMVFTLDVDNKLTTMKLLTFESVNNKTDDIITNAESSEKYASTKGVFTQFQRKPEVVYSDPTGFEASNSDVGKTWHLTGLNLSKYKRLKLYVSAGGINNDNYSPAHIVEILLDDRAKGSFGYFSGDHAGHCPNNRNRHHMVTFIVNAEKTAIQFQHSISMYGTAASDSAGGRCCYLIEGYYD